MNNREFATTGGQSTLVSEVSFAGVAEECGLGAWEARSTSEFESAYGAACEHDGPAVVSAAVDSTVPDEYPRPDYVHSHQKH